MANLVEEMGFDRQDHVTHAELYQRSLAAVGAAPDDLGPFEETRSLVKSMTDYCNSDESIEGLAALCLGGGGDRAGDRGTRCVGIQ